MREREDASRTREAGHLDEIQGFAASMLRSYRNGPAYSRRLSELAYVRGVHPSRLLGSELRGRFFIDFHEKAFKLKMKFISLGGLRFGIGLPCGLGVVVQV